MTCVCGLEFMSEDMEWRYSPLLFLHFSFKTTDSLFSLFSFIQYILSNFIDVFLVIYTPLGRPTPIKFPPFLRTRNSSVSSTTEHLASPRRRSPITTPTLPHLPYVTSWAPKKKKEKEKGIKREGELSMGCWNHDSKGPFEAGTLRFSHWITNYCKKKKEMMPCVFVIELYYLRV